MVIGAPTAAVPVRARYYWQIYEVTGLGAGRDAGHHAGRRTSRPTTTTSARSTAPTTASSSRPTGRATAQRHLYPQLDEYEEAPTVTGLWSLDPASGDLRLLDHAPSGDFSPIVDSFGRVIFTRWDHLQRDQQADADAHRRRRLRHLQLRRTSGRRARACDDRAEVFPEPRAVRAPTCCAGTNLDGHTLQPLLPLADERGRHRARRRSTTSAATSCTATSTAASTTTRTCDEFIAATRAASNHERDRATCSRSREDPTTPGTLLRRSTRREFGTHARGPDRRAARRRRR